MTLVRSLAILLAAACISLPSAAQVAPRFRNLDGNWFDPAAPGWGISIVQGDSGALFGVWFSYARLGADHTVDNPVWLVMPAGRWTSETTFEGQLYQTRGPGYDQRFDPAMVETRPAGTVTLTFTNDSEARFDGFHVETVFSTSEARRHTQATLRRFQF